MKPFEIALKHMLTVLSKNPKMTTGVVIDPAGNAWVANNWEVIEGVVSNDPPRPISTKGGGSGIVVIYGVAAPVKTPLRRRVRTP
jgi:hypothetical protein